MDVIRLSEDFLVELRFRNPIEEVVSSYVNLKRSGSNMKGLCPFHNERTPSFTVYTRSSSYYCFGCGNGGDVITFIRSIENLDYMESIKFLAERSGLSMPESGYDDSQDRLRRTLMEINREAARYFHERLVSKADGAIGLQYLAKRKLSAQTIKHFGIGYAPDEWHGLVDHLKSKGFRESDMVLVNVAKKSEKGGCYDRFRKKIIFPIIDLRGNVIAFGARKFNEDEGAKYINTADTMLFKKSKNLYGLNYAKNSKQQSVILTEGYMDTIALHQAGFPNAIGALGTAFTDEQATLISRYFEEVVVCMDTDGPGQAATKRCIEKLNKTGLKIRVLQVEGGKDPDEYIRENGAQRFDLLLKGAKNDIEFKLLKAQTGYDISVDSQRLEYFEKAADILAQERSDVAINIYASRLASQLNIDKGVVVGEIEKRRKSHMRTREKAYMRKLVTPSYTAGDVNAMARTNRRAAAAEETILTILMGNPSLGKIVFPRLSEDKFITLFNRRVYSDIKEIITKTDDFNISMLPDGYTPQETGRIALIQNREFIDGDVKGMLIDCIKVLCEENDKLAQTKAEDMNNDEFEQAFKNLKKKKGKD